MILFLTNIGYEYDYLLVISFLQFIFGRLGPEEFTYCARYLANSYVYII